MDYYGKKYTPTERCAASVTGVSTEEIPKFE
jgi:hypothetical protein